MDLGLGGRRALVSGASRGLGFAVAMRLASEGADLAITARDAGRLEEAREQLERTGRRVIAIPADLGDLEAVERVSKRAVDELGGVDILVANTGGPPTGPVVDVEQQEWRAAIDEMLLSVVELVRGTVAGMRVRGWGRIIFMTSSWVKQPRVGGGLSAGVRSAVSALSKQLALELAGDGVLVNQVLPGPCWTDRAEKIVNRIAQERGVSPLEVREQVAAELPLGRYGQPEEVADLVAFLASERASFITGTAIPVDGGQIRAML